MTCSKFVAFVCAATLTQGCAGSAGTHGPVLPATRPMGRAALAGNGKIAFRINVTAGGKTTANIYLMSSEHANPASPTKLLRLTNTAWNDQASWSPDGTKIVYTQESSYNGTASRIVVMSANGSHKKALTTFADMDSVPCFSPDGTKIAFRRDQSGTQQIFVMNADGSNPAYVTDGISPVWSPDGTWIAYSNGNIWAIHPDGTGAHAITNVAAGAFEPAWSPDGTQISFTSSTGGSTNVWLVNPDGTNVHQLTFGAYDLESYWSPDSSMVLYDDWTAAWPNPGSVAHLGVINRDGTGAAVLTPHIPNSGIEPAWQPVGT